ncbi:unnamed protein product [Schistosoma margrebowiei]|uniref:Uncharacterized protein n=1 Tax=Schistosoma margrebowiei TaxID=48269 RepID=A0A183N553_9TREM|nr:unnamed protein product [Schistosoma margrebowiei]
MQTKSIPVATVSALVGINLQIGKAESLKFNTENANRIKFYVKNFEDVESFTYLGSIIDEQEGLDAD